jgi:hypothetical protein
MGAFEAVFLVVIAAGIASVIAGGWALLANRRK